MKQEKSEAKLDTKEIILSSALKLFREKGFDEATMRDIARASKMAAGAAYYHFASKDDLVFVFYQGIEKAATQRCDEFNATTKNFNARLKDAFDFKINQLSKDRTLILALARSAADPKNCLSPFSKESKEIRDRVIKMFEDIIAGSDLKVSDSLRAELKNILWLSYLGTIFFWAHDPSKNQKLTEQLVGLTLKLTKDLVPLSRLPLTGPFQKAIVKVSQTIMGLAQE